MRGTKCGGWAATVVRGEYRVGALALLAGALALFNLTPETVRATSVTYITPSQNPGNFSTLTGVNGTAPPTTTTVVNLMSWDTSSNPTRLGWVNTNNGGVVQQSIVQPAGNGVFQPFDWLRATGSSTYEVGYNTTVDDQANNKAGPWTHALRLDQLDPVRINSGPAAGDYYEFALNLNETGSGPQISLDKFEIFLTNSPSIGGFTAGQPYPNPPPSYSVGTPNDSLQSSDGGFQYRQIYNLDVNQPLSPTATINDTTVDLSTNPSPGIGQSDYYVLIPISYFLQNKLPGTNYVVLYSALGVPPGSTSGSTTGFYPANAGFEAWSAMVPLPPSALGGAMLLGLLLAKRKWSAVHALTRS